MMFRATNESLYNIFERKKSFNEWAIKLLLDYLS